MLAKTLLLTCLVGTALAAAVPIDNIPVEVRYDAKHLDAKVQLSQEQLGQAAKHLPQPPVEATQPPVESTKPPVESPVAVLRVAQAPKEASQLQQLRVTVLGELKRLRDSFRPGQGQAAPDTEQWASLEKAVDDLFERQDQVKQAEGSTAAPAEQNNNIFQNIMNGVTQLTQGWVANIQNGAQGDTGTEGNNNQGGFQGFVQYFTNGVSNIMNQLQNNQSTTSSTVLGDSEVTSSSPNNPLAVVGGFFSSVANNVQQAFNRPSSSPQGTQGDTDGSAPTSGAPNPIQAIQNFGNSVGSAFTNIFQGQSQTSTSGDEGVPANGASNNNNVNFIQSIGNAIQNSPLNPFRPQSSTTQKPVEAVQPSGTEAPADGNQKKPAQETPVIEEVVPEKVEEPQKDNEIEKETLVASQ